MTPLSISLLVEDHLGQVILRKILKEFRPDINISSCYGHRGYGYIKAKATGFNRASKGIPIIILSDLEAQCAPAQIGECLHTPKHNNLLFRVAVKEVEAWILADRSGFSSFLSISKKLIPQRVDEIFDPKRFLISLAKRSRNRSLRYAIVPHPNSTARVGPDYNSQLSFFVLNKWNLQEAIINSQSLHRAVNAIVTFRPTC